LDRIPPVKATRIEGLRIKSTSFSASSALQEKIQKSSPMDKNRPTGN
jgi:hypothetical protein